jgi:hypothetical protein
MINPKVRAAALDFIKSQNPSQLEGQELHDAYEAECRLFNEHFKGMTKSELNDYSGFVQWLDHSEMWKSDLTVDKLWDVFESMEYDLLTECYEADLDF